MKVTQTDYIKKGVVPDTVFWDFLVRPHYSRLVSGGPMLGRSGVRNEYYYYC